MFPLTFLPVGVIVLALAACGMSGPPTGDSVGQVPALDCGLAITQRGGRLQIDARLQAAQAVTGQYALTVAQNGQAGQSFIDQSGDFTARAGEVVSLGSASISGSAAQYSATLTLDYDQSTIICPVTMIGQ